ncbi:MAG: hypothetical protein EPO65_06775 [Dehalococcoidia bacterium]|nr:MAG: hypothetical protein EPO65_06775 [Dehalococcoidia bacterium]
MAFPAGPYASGMVPALPTFPAVAAGPVGFGNVASRGVQAVRAAQIAPTVRATLSREEASFNASAKWSGIVAVAAVLAGVWALDRYVLDVPFVKATAA